MTTEHKILALVDRGYFDEPLTAALLDVEPSDITVHMAPPATLYTLRGGTLRLTGLGLARLDQLDESKS